MKNILNNLIILAILIVGSIAVVALKPTNLGLDLKGGVSIVLEPDIEKALFKEYEKYSKDIEVFLDTKDVKILDVNVKKDGIYVEIIEEENTSQILEEIEQEFPRFAVRREKDGLIHIYLDSQEITKFERSIISQAIEILRNRIDALGVAQPVITKIGPKRILIELPGYLDLERAKRIIGRTASLELKIVIDSAPIKEVLEEKLTKDTEILPSLKGQEWFLLEKVPAITGGDLKTAYQSADEFGSPAVAFELKGESASKFGEFTQRNIGKRLAIVLDGKVVSAPVIRSRISNRGQITGYFTPEEARDLAVVLRAGALPTDLQILQERIVGPSLGKDAIEQGMKAGLLGFALLLTIVIVRYKIAGVIATFSILLNAILLWAGLVLLDATLTLPGIAGIILNMGIAVDSNVLIFERFKEELRLGNTLRKAIELGYRRSLSAVWDTHITLLVASLILFQFGSGPVKGFATTLAIGTIASFISNVHYTKVLLDLLAKYRILKI